MSDLHTKIVAALREADRHMALADEMPIDLYYRRLADSVLDILIDMAGHGELLKSIAGIGIDPTIICEKCETSGSVSTYERGGACPNCGSRSNA